MAALGPPEGMDSAFPWWEDGVARCLSRHAHPPCQLRWREDGGAASGYLCCRQGQCQRGSAGPQDAHPSAAPCGQPGAGTRHRYLAGGHAPSVRAVPAFRLRCLQLHLLEPGFTSAPAEPISVLPPQSPGACGQQQTDFILTGLKVTFVLHLPSQHEGFLLAQSPLPSVFSPSSQKSEVHHQSRDSQREKAQTTRHLTNKNPNRGRLSRKLP